MKYLAVCGLVLLMAVPVMATPSLQISLGVREATISGVPITGYPGDFYTSANPAGGIEWFNLDQQTLVLDGTWQQFTIDLSATGISSTSFTGNGVVDQDLGTVDCIRIVNDGHYSHAITVWIDNIHNIYDTGPLPPPATDEPITTFDGVDGNAGVPYADGAEVMFQEPTFSGSTSNRVATSPNFAGIDNAVGQDDLHSTRVETKFIVPPPAEPSWLRLTPYHTVGKTESNPVVALARTGGAYSSSTMTFWMMGVPEPATLALLALGGLAVLRRR